ncbi:hypothetical protein [Halobacteriaceae bacterium SHR40]|uniref:hypothetical protein n=1 Tax=Halovenus amylolytica TaxID=2500550 RepID=UPI000FE372B0
MANDVSTNLGQTDGDIDKNIDTDIDDSIEEDIDREAGYDHEAASEVAGDVWTIQGSVEEIDSSTISRSRPWLLTTEFATPSR